MYKKLMLIIVVFVLLSFQNVYGKQNVVMTHSNYATVVKVIDGDSMLVKLFSTGDFALVKLIGVDTKGYDDAFQYSYNRLMGKTVFLYLGSNANSNVDRWNMVYMKENNELINSKLITMGYGMATITMFNTNLSNYFSTLENQAKSDGVGMWTNKDSLSDSTNTNNNNSYYYDTNSININTASSYELHQYLDSVSTTLAQSIVDYREYGYFSKVSDVKFVDGMTKEIYDKNVKLMHVITNINKAKLNELSSLISMSDTKAQAIIDYRTKNGNITVSSLVDDGLMTNSQYNDNKKFICDNDTSINNNALVGNIANINSASASTLVNAGFTNTEADKIVTYRNKGYTFKTVGELLYVSGLNMTENELLRLKNNLTVGTNSNSYTNINTASLDELNSIGLTKVQAYTLFSSKGRIKDYTNMPIDVTSYNSSITLYTNINNASSKELMSLDSNITSAIAADILSYTGSQPFGTMDEFRNYMDGKGNLNIYNDIVNYIVLY